MVTPALPPFPQAGELAAITAAIIWAGVICIYRSQAADLPAATINLFKNCLSCLCLLILAWITAAPWPTDPGIYLTLGASGLAGLVISDTAMFAALKRLGAQRTAVLQCLSPPLSALLGAFVLNEKLNPYAGYGLIMTVAGVAGVIIFGPRDARRLEPSWRLGVFLALLAAAGQSVGLLLARRAFQETDVAVGTVLRLLPAILVLAFMAIRRGRTAAGWDRLFDSSRRVSLLTLAAVGGGFVGLYLLSAATKFAPLGITSTLSSTFPIWLIPISLFILKEQVTGGQALSTLVAVGGIALIFYS